MRRCRNSYDPELDLVYWGTGNAEPVLRAIRLLSGAAADGSPRIPHYGAACGATTERRSPGLPEVPTFQKAGIKGLVIEPWFGVFVPAGAGRDHRPPQLPPELCKFQRDANPGL